MKSDLSSAPVQPSEEKSSPLGFYLLIGALVAGLVLIALIPIFM